MAIQVDIAGDMIKAVYDSDEDNRIEKDALEITLNKLLKGAGAGADPTEIDVPAGTAITSGSYSGDETANRAIGHGLGVTPKIILMTDTSGWFFIFTNYGYIHYIDLGHTESYDVTDPDATNFYVGNAAHWAYSGNGSGSTYYWVAIG